MRPLWILAVAVLVTGCSRDVIRVGAPPDAASQLASALLAREMGAKRVALHREVCANERRCLAALRSGDLDIVVVGSASMGTNTEILASSGLSHRPRLVVRAGGADVAPGARVAMSRSFAQAGVGVALDGATREFIESAHDRLAALDDGRVDAAVIDEAVIVGEVRRLSVEVPERELSFVIASDSKLSRSSEFRGAAASISARVAELDTPRVLAAIASGVEPREAIAGASSDPLRLSIEGAASINALIGANAVARSLAPRGVMIHRGATGDADLVISQSTPSGLEAVAVFELGGSPPATLWQSATEPRLEVSDAERILAASAFARVPSADIPSMWTQASERAGNGRVAVVQSEVLDSIVNVLVCLFVVWLVVSIFRRSNMPAWETDDDQAPDRD